MILKCIVFVIKERSRGASTPNQLRTTGLYHLKVEHMDSYSFGLFKLTFDLFDCVWSEQRSGP